MLSSFKARFIFIYLILILICMSIVGSFLINRLEESQMKTIETEMNETVDSMVASANYLKNRPWEKEDQALQNTLDGWRLSSSESMYVLSKDEVPKILAASVNSKEQIKGKNALAQRDLNPDIILNARKGQVATVILENNSHIPIRHLAKPVFSPDGQVQGIFYMQTSLEPVYGVIQDTKTLLTYATVLGLFITTILGFFIANSVTEPVREITSKAKEMAEGNFDQKVEVKSRDEIGQMASMFNYLTGELKETINKMDIERSKLDTIFHYMAEGVIAIDRKNNLIHINPIAKGILNLEEDVYEGKVPMDLASLNLRDINYYAPSSLSGEAQLDRGNHFYNMKYAPYRNELGENSGLIVVFQDITKEHQLDEMRKEFVANVSHELKTPLTSIKSYTETLMDPDLNVPVRLRFLKVIEREADRMASLVRDLLQLSNIDNHSLNLQMENLDTYGLVDGVLEGLRPLLEEKHQRLFLNIAPDIASIFGDSHGIQRILNNIISNAIKYTEDGGDISIEAKNWGPRVQVQVKDTGLGIPAKDMDRIFERFYRVEKGRSRRMGGTGLGLSIAKELMESMGGRIDLSSTLGKGTTVTLLFKGGEKLEWTIKNISPVDPVLPLAYPGSIHLVPTAGALFKGPGAGEFWIQPIKGRSFRTEKNPNPLFSQGPHSPL